jgi:lysozyme family protein
MTASTYDEALRRLLLHEGGYSNHPQDPGGPTNFGITIADYRKYLKPGASADDVRAMKLDEAKGIYRAKYWSALRCDELPAGIDDSIFDYGVNSGIGRAGKVLRRVIGMSDTTWIVTDDVICEVDRRDSKKVIAAINDERLRFLQSLPTWPIFGKGWSQRVDDVRIFSQQLADQSHIDAEPSVVEGASAKGMVPQPRILKATVAKGGPAVATISAIGFIDWINAHPVASIGIAAASFCAVAGASFGLNQLHRARQEAPTPGLVPVTTSMKENLK